MLATAGALSAVAPAVASMHPAAAVPTAPSVGADGPSGPAAAFDREDDVTTQHHTMNFNDFTGEVQHRIDTGTQGEAVRTTRAVLTTLGERLGEGEASDLAAPLPMEIDRYLLEAASGERFPYDEFVDRVAERADLEEADAAFAAKAVVALAAELAPPGEIDDLLASLPPDFGELFEFVDAAEADAPW